MPACVLLAALVGVFTIATGCRPVREDRPSATAAAPSNRLGIPFSELLEGELPPADARIAYGTGPLQYGELRLPPGRGPFPVAVIIHGGCWLKQYDIRHAAREAAALTAAGIATWTIEYRRADDDGGGWPGTFEDVARGTDHVRKLAEEYRLDLRHVVLVGHSAGGQLALWLASRQSHPSHAPVSSVNPLPIRGVVSLASITDLQSYGAIATRCGEAVATLLDGPPSGHPDRYDAVSPVALLPLRVPVSVVHGTADTAVPVDQGRDYIKQARAAGDVVNSAIIAGAGHFDLISPGSGAWPVVLGEVKRLLG